MDDQISRNTLLRYVADWQYSEAIVGNEAVYDTIEKFYHMVEEMPSAQPEQIARDIATIIENEKDMRVVLKNAEHTETHSCDYQRTETHGWITVTEALPKEEDCPMDCLVTRKSKFIGNYTDIAVCEKNGTWTHEDWDAIVLGDVEDGKSTGLISTRDDNIIAWMPLPEPYAERKEDE